VKLGASFGNHTDQTAHPTQSKQLTHFITMSRITKVMVLMTVIMTTVVLFFISCKKEDTSKKDDPSKTPTLTTLKASDISVETALSGGDITDDGGSNISSRGIVWSINLGPTIENHTGITTEGNGKGQFTSTLTGLTPATQYFIRAYATNSAGTAYGNQVSFSTLGTAVGVYPAGFVHCDPANPTAIVDVTNPHTGKTWMDRNLGASQAATASTDVSSYGDLYQWGRFADGHQCRNSDTTSILSTSDMPGHGKFILAPTTPGDWRNPQKSTLWLGVNGVNNPCPGGYRLPTLAEWNIEHLSWISKDAAGAFASPLKLPMAGTRSPGTGELEGVGTVGYYWSSAVGPSTSRYLIFTETAATIAIYYSRAWGYSVRCIKND